MPDASQWLRKLGALNVSGSKDKGPAPNKLLLFLAVLVSLRTDYSRLMVVAAGFQV